MNSNASLNPGSNKSKSKERADDSLPLLYIPANLYKLNADQINKKSREGGKQNKTENKTNLNNAGKKGITHKSIKNQQKSMEEFEVKS